MLVIMRQQLVRWLLCWRRNELMLIPSGEQKCYCYRWKEDRRQEVWPLPCCQRKGSFCALAAAPAWPARPYLCLLEALLLRCWQRCWWRCMYICSIILGSDAYSVLSMVVFYACLLDWAGWLLRGGGGPERAMV